MRDAGLGLEVVQGGVQESAAVRTKVCWNVKCGTSSSTNWRPGWLLRAGHTADLCDSCGLAYEQSRFCETFHSDDAGWRTCNSCKKRVHCGCIASVYGLVLLDKGGVECSGCVREDDVIASSTSLAGKKHGQQQLLVTALGHAANGKEVVDPALRRWGEGGGYGGAALVACQSEPWQPPSSAAAACEPHANNASGQQLAAPWDPDLKIEQQLMESSRSLRPAAKFQDQEMGFPSNLELHANNLDSSMKSVAAGSIACSPKETRETAATAGGGKGPPESPPGHVESSSPSSKSGTDQMPTGLTLSGGSSPVKQVTGEGGQQGGGSETGAAGESAGHGKASTTVGSYRPPRVRQLLPRPTIAGAAAAAAATLDPGFDAQAPPRVARPPGEGRGRNQLLPRYWPRITDQELQQIASGDSNTVITPLFEKMLSASDAGRIGRLVLPKACAEAYFPPIHQPEGLPLKIQDVTGKEWVFQFRFWPNNNSRMYVLEGVTPCIQSMRLQAGDTVTFSRLEADGKLVMGYRRAPSSLSSQVCGFQDATGIATTPPSNNGLPCASYAAPQSLDGWASSKGGASAKLKDSSAAAAAAAMQQMDRKRGRPLGSKSKRLRLDTGDALLLKSSWEEAQELLRPPPSAIPTTITIDGHEFEEYSEPPVFAKKTYPNITPSGEHEQWAQCDECGNWRRLPATAFVPLHWSCSQNTWDLTRAQCNAPQEVSNEKLELILRQVSGQEDGKQGGGNGSGSMRMMLVPTVAGDINTTTAATTAAAAAGLDTLAQAAAATTTGPVSPMRTTKHPRHRPGCSCIVCIQPPSGKGPKHKATCTCNVCVTVKRRFKTLMQRRKKRQFERESELARKKRGWARDDISDSASLLDAAPRPETSAGGGGGGGGGGGAVGEENPTTPLVYQSDDVGGGADEGGPSKAAATAAAIDLNSQPDRDERVSMVRLVQDAGKPLSTYLHQQHLMTLCAPDHPLSDKVSEEEDPNSSSSREEVASQTSSKAHADSGMQLVAAAAVTPMQQGQQQQPQSPFMVDIAELSSHMESWDPRAVKPVAEPSGDSVHSSSSKQEYNMLNQLVVSNAPASSKKYATGAGRGRQICSGCGEPIGSAAKVCRRCGTSTAFGKKKRSVPP